LRNHIFNGILATIALHLIIGIIFYSAKITGMYVTTVEVKVETPQTIKEDYEEQLKKMLQEREQLLKMAQRADALIAAQNRKNIGVNVADKTSPAMDKDLQDVQRELEEAKKQIASVQENLERQNEKKIITSDDKEAPSAGLHQEKPQGKLAVYKGPTNIYYDLAGRKTVYLYIPVYKCQSLGKVVVNIVVDASGSVVDAKVDKNQSDPDECLIEAAEDAALRSRFSAGEKQKGNITYLFVAQ